jgi:hypothetical protein
MPRVERDDDAALRGGRIGREQMVDEPARRADDDRAVHAVGTRPDPPAQTGGAEGQPTADEVLERCARSAVSAARSSCGECRIRIARRPFARPAARAPHVSPSCSSSQDPPVGDA